LGVEKFGVDFSGRDENYRVERPGSKQGRAQGVVTKELNRIGWSEVELRNRRKRDKKMVRLAARLRKETSMSLKWIAQWLEMGSWTYVSNLLIAERKKLCQ
jgi:hypothetical protein